MTYRVVIEAPALDDIEAYILWLSKDSPAAAARWYDRICKAIGSLAISPQRCPLAPENDRFSEEIRHLLSGRRPHVYRILFTTRGDIVHVLHVRHGARELLWPDD